MGNKEYIDTTELVKLCSFIHEPWLWLFQCLPLVHGNCTISKCRRSASKTWWPTFQVGAINTAINTEHSGSRELERSKFFCICYAPSSAERKRRPTVCIETVYWECRTGNGFLFFTYICGILLVNGWVRMKLMSRESCNCSKSSFWCFKCDLYTNERIWAWNLLWILLLASICQRLPRMDEVTGEWRKLHNEDLNDLYSSPNYVRVIKSRRMRWEANVARTGERRGVYSVSVGKPEGQRPLGRPRRRWEDNIKKDLQEVGCEVLD